MTENFRFSEIVESAHDIIIVTMPDPNDFSRQKIIYVNPAFTSLTGYTADEALGKYARLLELFESEKKKEEVLTALENWKPARAIIQSRSKSGDKYWLDLVMVPLRDRNGEHRYFASIERNITKEKQLFDDLTTLSMTDPLTGLLNRRALQKLVDKEISRYKRTRTPFCFLLIDLDHFKNINDTYGHDCGDKVLQEVATCLSGGQRPYDFAARIGGEEFFILLSGTDMDAACRFAIRLKQCITGIEIKSDRRNIGITASIGISQVFESDSSLEQLLKRADDALYQAKESGRNRIIKFESDGFVRVDS